MAARQERHARSRDRWDTQPSRSAETAAAASADPDPAKRPPGRKDTRRWCGGKPGREHVPELVLTHDGFRPRTCQWLARCDYRLIRRGDDEHGVTVGWFCGHEERCTRCGKILRDYFTFGAGDCPDYPGSEEQRAEAEREAAAEPERWRAWAGIRRPAVTGPQHYRRKKAS